MDSKKQEQTSRDPMDSRRSVPPPPPSRRSPSSAPASQARPTMPELGHTPLPPPHVPPPSNGPLKPRLGSTPITELNRPRDAVRALHERELEHMREQQTQALAQAQEEKVAELAAQDLIHQTRLQSLNEEHQAQLQAVRAEGQAHLISMRRRVAAAAHLALEDRQGSLRYLEDENERLRARVHELEQQLGLPVTVFPDRPRTPSLPPEMFISPSLPPPASTAAIEPSDSRENAPNTPACLHPAGHDDLTRLRGVGPAIARALVQLGITQFSQIAHWTDADIERIAPRLRTRPNRIRKDGWVKSAQGLQNKV